MLIHVVTISNALGACVTTRQQQILAALVNLGLYFCSFDFEGKFSWAQISLVTAFFLVNVLFHYFMVSVLNENLATNCIGALLYFMIHFSLSCSQDFVVFGFFLADCELCIYSPQCLFSFLAGQFLAFHQIWGVYPCCLLLRSSICWFIVF